MPKPKKPTRGGKRPGAGRKPRVAGPVVRVEVRLSIPERDALVAAYGSVQAAVADLAGKAQGGEKSP